MREQQVQTKIMKYLKEQGAYTVKVVQATKAGVPDIICCYKGKFIGIEVKKPAVRNHKNGGATELQIINLANIKKANGKAIIAYGVEEVADALREV